MSNNYYDNADYVIPQDTCLGKMKTVEVYDYYDKPVMFSCKNENDQYFFVLSIEDGEDFEEWFYLPISIIKLKGVLKIDTMDAMYDLFRLSEEKHFFRVLINYKEDNVKVEKIDSKDVERKWFFGED